MARGWAEGLTVLRTVGLKADLTRESPFHHLLWEQREFGQVLLASVIPGLEARRCLQGRIGSEGPCYSAVCSEEG